MSPLKGVEETDYSENVLSKPQLSFNPPKVPGKDDVTGEPLSQRPDDNAVRQIVPPLSLPVYPLRFLSLTRNPTFSLSNMTDPYTQSRLLLPRD